MDVATVRSRFAIVAPTDLAYRTGPDVQGVVARPTSAAAKRLASFRTLDEALPFLGLTQAPEFPPLPPGIVAQKV